MLSLPSQDRTDGTVSAGGRIDIGDNKLTLAAAHVSQHEDRGAIHTIASDRPIAFQLDNIRASYLITDGRWSIVPGFEATNWTYSGTTVQGIPTSQAYRDRVVVQSGVTVRYWSGAVTKRGTGRPRDRPGLYADAGRSAQSEFRQLSGARGPRLRGRSCVALAAAGRC